VGKSKARQVIDGETHHFCCVGCSHVFLILSNLAESADGAQSVQSAKGEEREDGAQSTKSAHRTAFRDTELYRTCVAAGLIPRGGNDPATARPADDESPRPAKLPEDIQEGLAHDVALRLEGMWCSSCSWVIEEVLRNAPGVLAVKVSFLSDLVQVKYLPHLTSLQDLAARISRLGYRALPMEDRSKGGENRDLLLRLGISAIVTINIMMISFVLYFGFFQELEAGAVAYLSYPLWLLATPVVLYCGYPILERAFLGLVHGRVSMDTLISVGVLSAYLYSAAATLRGSLHLYFDTASMLVTLVLLGRFIEAKAKERVTAGIAELHELVGGKARRCWEGSEKWVATQSVCLDDEILVCASERIPVDGTVVAGRGSVDESVLTGESRPIGRSVGDRVMAGAMLLEGRINLRASTAGSATSLSQMVALMQEALSGKNPVELLADRITRRFVPFVLLLAAATGSFLLYRGAGADESLLRALTVLVITCPCALGIAVPLAKTASVGVGRASGMLIRDAEALEKAADLDVVIFDKTGTLTEGNFSLREVISPGCGKALALGRVAAVEAHSDHLLAVEILRKARADGLKVEEVSGFRSHEGLGVSGVTEGVEVFVGNRGLLRAQEMTLPREMDEEARLREASGFTTVFFGWGDDAEGFLVFGDTLRENARQTVSRLENDGIAVWMVSGDSAGTTRAVARELSIEQYVGQALPATKVEIIDGLRSSGHRVGMVGDGINDAAALARADVGIALGAGSNIIREASDITLLSSDPLRVLTVRKLSAATSRIIRQNLFFAFFYNVLSIPLAVAGALNPLIAVLAMFVSSLTVIANTLRISGLMRYSGQPGATAQKLFATKDTKESL
jgi:heavy metal translocating P-type ATPase